MISAGVLRIELGQAKVFENSPASQIKARFRSRKLPFRKDYSELPIRSDLFAFKQSIDSEELVNFCRSIGAQASGFPPRILRTPRRSFRRHFVPLASTYAGDGRPRTRR